MAESTSSRTALRMAIGFMTSRNEMNSHDATDDPTGAIAGGGTTSHMQWEGRETACPTNLGSTGAAAGVMARGVSAADQSRRMPTTSTPADGRWTQRFGSVRRHVPIPARSLHDNSPIDDTQESHALPSVEQVRTDQHGTTDHCVRVAWELRARADDKGKPSMAPGTGEDAVVSGSVGVPALSFPSGSSRQNIEQFGIKRSRTCDEYCSIGDQGREGKRVGSPHRLIRRVPALQGCGGQSARQERSRQFNTRKTHAEASAESAMQWEWADDDFDTSRSDINRARSTQIVSGEHGQSQLVSSLDDAALTLEAGSRRHERNPVQRIMNGSLPRHPVEHDSASGRIQVTDRTIKLGHHSLKVQRLSVGHIDSLTNSVESLDVVSPISGAVDVRNPGVSGRIHAWRRETRSGSRTGAFSGARLRPTSAASTRDMPSFRGSREQSAVGGCISGCSRKRRGDSISTSRPFSRTVPGEHRASVLTGAPTSTDEDVAPFTARTGLSSMTPTYRDLEADSTRNAKSIAREGKTGDAGRTNTNSVTADPTWKTEAGARSEQKLDRACACSRASSSRDAEPSSASAVALPGDVEAPGYDAAVNPPPCVSSGREVDDMLTAEGGEVDEDSSDGGAAYEEISAWLHSTDDWWIS